MMHQPVAAKIAPAFPNAAFDLVVLAASTGGVPPLPQVLGRLPSDFPAPLALVLHLPEPTGQDRALLGTARRGFRR
jgi:two-component system chemotaxis response regulator CheB